MHIKANRSTDIHTKKWREWERGGKLLHYVIIIIVIIINKTIANMFSSLFCFCICPMFASFECVIVYSVDLLSTCLVYNTILSVLEQTCSKFWIKLYNAWCMFACKQYRYVLLHSIEPKSNMCINLLCGNHLIWLVFALGFYFISDATHNLESNQPIIK